MFTSTRLFFPRHFLMCNNRVCVSPLLQLLMVNPRLISFLLAAYRSSDSRVLITFDLRDRGEEGRKH